MITRLVGKLVEKGEQSLVIDVHGVHYEAVAPKSVINRIEATKDADGNVHLITVHYFQISQSSGQPVLIGFISQIEKDFFNEITKVSGIGPKAAVKALERPISEIAQAINDGNLNYLKTLPGIGAQRAKDMIAKLQGKVSKFGLIQDRSSGIVEHKHIEITGWQEEALAVLLQLQYKKPEALEMIKAALERSKDIATTEELLNEIYKQKVKK